MSSEVTVASGHERPSHSAQPKAAAQLRIGAFVHIIGRRGRFRVTGLTPHGVELRDRDERWHVVRPEAVRISEAEPGAWRPR
ncbi:MAG TPA: hypothetical protein VGK51_16025 [Actinomycetota bacterium]